MEDEEAPLLFRCPISMEVMEDPTTLSTGVTYERKNIERWLYSYKKSTCPATMQRLHTFDLTPNHTLKRLIDSYQTDVAALHAAHPPTTPAAAEEHHKLVSLLADVQTSPFKVRSLKKLQSMVQTSLEVQNDFVRSGGIQVLTRVMSQVIVCEGAGGDFSSFRACEESVGVLHRLPIADAASADLLSRPDCIKPMMLLLQQGSAEARVHTMIILQKLSMAKAGCRANKDWMLSDQETEDVSRSLLELLSDEVSVKLSSCSLDVLVEIVAASKKNRQRAIEAGAVRVLVELLPDAANKHKCEKILLLLKMLCDCPEGRAAFVDHGLGVAAVSKKMLRVSDLATKLGVKILSLVCNFLPTEKVIDDMVVFGAVRKLFCLLHVDGRSATKEKAVKMIRVHGGVWKMYACFPREFDEHLKLVRRC